MNSSWRYCGFSHHSVPSLSNIATRSATGTSRGGGEEVDERGLGGSGPPRRQRVVGDVVMALLVAGSTMSRLTRHRVTFHGAEADVAHAGVDHLGASGRGSIALTVVVGAEERATLDDLARDAELRLLGVEARFDVGPAGWWARSTASSASSGWRCEYQSVVHSQTLPAMSYSPNPFGGNDPTGAVPVKPSASLLRHGKSPCQKLARYRPSGTASSPHTKARPSCTTARGVLPLGLGRQLLPGPDRHTPLRPRTRRERPDGRAGRRSTTAGPRGGATTPPASTSTTG